MGTPAALGLAQLAPPPTVLSPAPSSTMSPPLSEADAGEGGGSSAPPPPPSFCLAGPSSMTTAGSPRPGAGSPSTGTAGGRLRFYNKDGRVLLELSHSTSSPADGWPVTAAGGRWVSTSCGKTYWPPPTVSARIEHIPASCAATDAASCRPWGAKKRKSSSPTRRFGVTWQLSPCRQVTLDRPALLRLARSCLAPVGTASTRPRRRCRASRGSADIGVGVKTGGSQLAAVMARLGERRLRRGQLRCPPVGGDVMAAVATTPRKRHSRQSSPSGRSAEMAGGGAGQTDAPSQSPRKLAARGRSSPLNNTVNGSRAGSCKPPLSQYSIDALLAPRRRAGRESAAADEVISAEVGAANAAEVGSVNAAAAGGVSLAHTQVPVLHPAAYLRMLALYGGGDPLRWLPGGAAYTGGLYQQPAAVRRPVPLLGGVRSAPVSPAASSPLSPQTAASLRGLYSPVGAMTTAMHRPPYHAASSGGQLLGRPFVASPTAHSPAHSPAAHPCQELPLNLSKR